MVVPSNSVLRELGALSKGAQQTKHRDHQMNNMTLTNLLGNGSTATNKGRMLGSAKSELDSLRQSGFQKFLAQKRKNFSQEILSDVSTHNLYESEAVNSVQYGILEPSLEKSPLRIELDEKSPENLKSPLLRSRHRPRSSVGLGSSEVQLWPVREELEERITRQLSPVFMEQNMSPVFMEENMSPVFMEESMSPVMEENMSHKSVGRQIIGERFSSFTGDSCQRTTRQLSPARSSSLNDDAVEALAKDLRQLTRQKDDDVLIDYGFFDEEQAMSKKARKALHLFAEDPTRCMVNNETWKLHAVLGRGAFGLVYKVSRDSEQPKKKFYALKTIQCKNRAQFEANVQEVELLRKFRKHAEHVVQIIVADTAYIELERTLRIIFELADQDLSGFLKARPLLTMQQLCVLSQKVTDTVAVIHDYGVVHFDLKPANFLVVRADKKSARKEVSSPMSLFGDTPEVEDDPDYCIKLGDFGMACRVSVEDNSITKKGPLGTLAFMAPEMWRNTNLLGRNELKLHLSADCWSLGCVLYFIVYRSTIFARYCGFCKTPKQARALANDANFVVTYPREGAQILEYVQPANLSSKSMLSSGFKSRVGGGLVSRLANIQSTYPLSLRGPQNVPSSRKSGRRSRKSGVMGSTKMGRHSAAMNFQEGNMIPSRFSDVSARASAALASRSYLSRRDDLTDPIIASSGNNPPSNYPLPNPKSNRRKSISKSKKFLQSDLRATEYSTVPTSFQNSEDKSFGSMMQVTTLLNDPVVARDLVFACYIVCLSGLLTRDPPSRWTVWQVQKFYRLMDENLLECVRVTISGADAGGEMGRVMAALKIDKNKIMLSSSEDLTEDTNTQFSRIPLPREFEKHSEFLKSKDFVIASQMCSQIQSASAGFASSSATQIQRSYLQSLESKTRKESEAHNRSLKVDPASKRRSSVKISRKSTRKLESSLLGSDHEPLLSNDPVVNHDQTTHKNHGKISRASSLTQGRLIVMLIIFGPSFILISLICVLVYLPYSCAANSYFRNFSCLKCQDNEASLPSSSKCWPIPAHAIPDVETAVSRNLHHPKEDLSAELLHSGEDPSGTWILPWRNSDTNKRW